ncbi:dihydrofolate reductase domain-containing protein [Ditylenchus destructor]|nr:dihydrofolate reductase domain-containing protein [Ditylenchus destructor]
MKIFEFSRNFALSSRAMQRMNMIVAVDANYGIGRNNDLPWKLPKEYAHFVRETTKVQDENKINAVIMGRRCWESIPEKYKPLKNRINVVLSRTMEPMILGDFVVTRSLDEALKVLSESEQFKDRIETIWNAGGRDVYAEGLTHPWMHKLVITRIEKEFECDVKFPDVDWSKFETNDDYVGTEVEKCEEKGVVWRVFSYTRKA